MQNSYFNYKGQIHKLRKEIEKKTELSAKFQQKHMVLNTFMFCLRPRPHYEDYVITVKYPAKLNCSQSELLAEFNSCWPVIGKTWQEKKTADPNLTAPVPALVHQKEVMQSQTSYAINANQPKFQRSCICQQHQMRKMMNTCLKQHAKFFRKRNITNIYYSKAYIYYK